MRSHRGIVIQVSVGVVALAQVSLAFAQAPPVPPESEWRPLFNGRDLEGWIPKVNHRPLGENYQETFLVKDAVLRVSYLEIEVQGSKRARHIIDGQVVLEYENLQLNPTDPFARKLLQQESQALGAGYISLQGESHPVEFRNIEIMKLPE